MADITPSGGTLSTRGGKYYAGGAEISYDEFSRRNKDLRANSTNVTRSRVGDTTYYFDGNNRPVDVPKPAPVVAPPVAPSVASPGGRSESPASPARTTSPTAPTSPIVPTYQSTTSQNLTGYSPNKPVSGIYVDINERVSNVNSPYKDLLSYAQEFAKTVPTYTGPDPTIRNPAPSIPIPAGNPNIIGVAPWAGTTKEGTEQYAKQLTENRATYQKQNPSDTYGLFYDQHSRKPTTLVVG